MRGQGYTDLEEEVHVTYEGDGHVADVVGRKNEETVAVEIGSIGRTDRIWTLCQVFDVVYHLPYGETEYRKFTKDNAPEYYRSGMGPDYRYVSDMEFFCLMSWAYDRFGRHFDSLEELNAYVVAVSFGDFWRMSVRDA